MELFYFILSCRYGGNRVEMKKTNKQKTNFTHKQNIMSAKMKCEVSILLSNEFWLNLAWISMKTLKNLLS